MPYSIEPPPSSIPIDKALLNINTVIRSFQGDASQHESLRCSIICVIQRLNECDEFEQKCSEQSKEIEALKTELKKLTPEKVEEKSESES